MIRPFIIVLQYNFIAVTCGVKTTDATERKRLIHHITTNGWREDGTLWHASSQCASSIYEATNNLRKNSGAGRLCVRDIMVYTISIRVEISRSFASNTPRVYSGLLYQEV